MKLAAAFVALFSLSAFSCSSAPNASPNPNAAYRPPSPFRSKASFTVPPLGSAKFRVCAFGFHNPLELSTIRAELAGSDFVFTDLTPTAEESAAVASSASPAGNIAGATPPAWLMNRCRPDLRCDVIIYSGEFAGGFFGKYGVSLRVQDMEEASCQASCQGLFRQPREAFLMACNTLATKSADNRSQDEYLRVLLAHGFSRPDAERVVDLRYGPFGPSFKESLRRIFMGVPRIYGFSSVAPKGEVTAPRLKQYFQRQGDYAQYLRQTGRNTAPNRELLSAFSGTSLVQTTGLMPLEPVAADRSMVCRLYDDKSTVAARLGVVHKLLARPDFLAFVPNVEVFLSRNPPEKLGAEEKQILKRIQSLGEPRTQMATLMQQLHVSGLKAQMAHLSLQLGWITPPAFDRLAADSARQLLAEPVSSESADIACELSRYSAAGASLRSEDIPEQFFLHWEGFQLLDCLAPKDPRVTTRMLAGLRDIDESIRMWATHALSRRLPLDDVALRAVARSLNDPSAGVRARARWILAAQKPLPTDVVAALGTDEVASAKMPGVVSH